MVRESGSPPSALVTVIGSLRLVLVDRDYRSIFIMLVLLGVNAGCVVPYLTVWIEESYGVSIFYAGLVFAPMSVLGLCVNLVVAARSDRTGRRRRLIIATLIVGIVSRIALSTAHSYLAALILFAFTGIGPFSLVFALLRDVTRAKEAQSGGNRIGAITGTQRMGFSLGFLAGPIFGAAVTQSFGFPALFLGSAGLLCVMLVWAGRSIRDWHHERSPAGSAGNGDSSRLARWGSLALLMGTTVLLFSADQTRMVFLPLFITNVLHRSVSLIGPAFAITVVGELVMMPLSGHLADSIGVTRMFLIGVLGQALFFFLLGVATAYWEVLVLQACYAFVVSITMGVGMVYAQTVSRAGTGVATTAYVTSMGIAPALSGTILGALAGQVGMSGVFMIAGTVTLGSFGLALIARQRVSRQAAAR